VRIDADRDASVGDDGDGYRFDGDDSDAQFNARISAHVTPTVDDSTGRRDTDCADAHQQHPDGWCDDHECCPPPYGREDNHDPALEGLAQDCASNASPRTARSSRPQRFDRKVAWGISGLAAASAVAVLIGALTFYSGSRAQTPASPLTALGDPQAVAVAKPAPSADPSPATGADRPLPYTADAAESCPAGSTAAQTMAGADPRNAFVCVRNGLDGQVIDIDLGKTYVITAISLTPGWVGLDASGVSQWAQHRVITTVQYRFNDTDRTLITQQTGDVHGEAVQPVKRVLASKVQLLIRQTSRPPAGPTATTAAGSGGGLTSVLGADAPTVPLLMPPVAADVLGPTAQSNTDPADATFAISTFKIIGHEAI
jgi:hypothetical protein